MKYWPLVTNIDKIGFPYSLQSVGTGADPGAQAVSPQVTIVIVTVTVNDS